VTERVLTLRELNRALLARQLLLERTKLPVARAVERVAGLQAQETRAPYVGLWTRLDDFDRAALTGALKRRTVVKATVMRATLHLVSARDYVLFQPALDSSPSGNWQSYRQGLADAERLARRAEAFAKVPRTSTELREHLGAKDERWWRVTLYRPFVRVPTGEDWAFGPRTAWVAARHWLEQPFGTAEAGVVQLLRRYLAAFGPGTLQDAAAWSGMPVKALRPAVEALAPRLRRFRDERGRLLLDLRGAPLPPADAPAPVRLLPNFDNALLSHADRTRIVSDANRRTVIRGGMVDPTFLVDGFVAGQWRLERGTLQLEPFGRLPASARRSLLEEGERLAAFLE
jgi:hypothetical protein